MQARLTKVIEEKYENDRILHLEDSERPTRKFTIKLKGEEEPIEVNAHTYNQVLENKWLRFYLNRKSGSSLMIFACHVNNVDWFKGESVE
jgi:hypothetical protein